VTTRAYHPGNDKRFLVEVRRSDGRWQQHCTNACPLGFKTRRGADALLRQWHDDGIRIEARIRETTGDQVLDERLAEPWTRARPIVGRSSRRPRDI
jgi:hypothetical protein